MVLGPQRRGVAAKWSNPPPVPPGTPAWQQERFKPPPRALTFKQKIPQWRIVSAACVIQAFVRRRMRENVYSALDHGRSKLYVQKHAAAAMDGAAIFMQKHYRRRKAMRERQDLADEKRVHEYNQQKRFSFKPRYPPSYYRASAAVIQAKTRARQASNAGDQASALARWERLRRLYRTGGAQTVITALEAPPVVFKPRLSQADALRVKRMRSVKGGSNPILVARNSPSRTKSAPPTAPIRVAIASSSGSSCSGSSSRGAGADGAGQRSDLAPTLPPTAAAATLQPAAVAAAAGMPEVPMWLEEADERQQEAESYFLLADTSGDGLVDEGELVVLIMKILKLEPADQPKVEAFVARFRPDDGSGIELDFDDFVDVYNSFTEARKRGEI